MSLKSKPFNHWSKANERGTVLGMKILLLLYRYCGRTLLWIPLFPIVFYLYLTGKETRQASLSFLQQVEKNNHSKKIINFWHGLQHFCCFANSTFDKADAWLGRIKHQEIQYSGDTLFSDIVMRRKGGILIGSHLGNLEVCRALNDRQYYTPINILVFTENAIKFNQILTKINHRVTVNLMQVSQINPGFAVLLKEKVDRGEIIVIVGDRTSVTSVGRVSYANFLGKLAPFSQGPFILAAILECPVYWLFCLKEKKKFTVIIEHVSDQLIMPRKARHQALQQVIERYAQRLGHYASLYPYQWFNFFHFWQKDEQVSRQ